MCGSWESTPMWLSIGLPDVSTVRECDGKVLKDCCEAHVLLRINTGYPFSSTGYRFSHGIDRTH